MWQRWEEVYSPPSWNKRHIRAFLLFLGGGSVCFREGGKAGNRFSHVNGLHVTLSQAVRSMHFNSWALTMRGTALLRPSASSLAHTCIRMFLFFLPFPSFGMRDRVLVLARSSVAQESPSAYKVIKNLFHQFMGLFSSFSLTHSFSSIKINI